jgi:flagellar hook assembly protein FlgD
VSGVKTSGTHQEVWDGRDDFGNSVGSGIYFYRLQAGSFVESKKMVLLK